MKVLSVVGNRPQFIKSAPLSLALRAAGIDEVVVHTGQHYDDTLSEIFYAELALDEPRHRLDLRTADPEAMRPGITAAIAAEEPDWVLVYGDTNSTLAGALAGTRAGVAVAHVEAGLRSGDLAMPEERNRIAVDRMSALLFAPDDRSAAILQAESVGGAVAKVGDVMADAARIFAPLARERISIDMARGSYLVATIHREANVTQPRLGRIVEGLNRIPQPIVFPAHPRTAAAIHRENLVLGEHIDIVAPLGYLEMTALASQARVILTDSGGLQKEAYWYGVPCVTMRPSTEWVDTVEAGANTLVDDDPSAIAAAAAHAAMPANRPELYGDGHASERIADALLDTMPAR